jgi:hypothetical protein
MALLQVRHLDAVAKREEQVMLQHMQEAETLIRSERTHLAAMKERRRRQLRALQARQRIEGFEKKVLEQKGSWRHAAHEHDRQVHRILLDLEEERRALLSMDEEILVRERELRKKCEALDAQRDQHALSFGRSPEQRSKSHSDAQGSSPDSAGMARRARGQASPGQPAGRGRFAHIDLDSEEEDGEGASAGGGGNGAGTPLDFTPKALRREVPAGVPEPQDDAATGEGEGGGEERGGESGSAAAARMLAGGRASPPGRRGAMNEELAEAVVMAGVGMQGGEGGTRDGSVAREGGQTGAHGSAASGSPGGGGGGAKGRGAEAAVDKKPGEKGYWQVRSRGGPGLCVRGD